MPQAIAKYSSIGTRINDLAGNIEIGRPVLIIIDVGPHFDSVKKAVDKAVVAADGDA